MSWVNIVDLFDLIHVLSLGGFMHDVTFIYDFTKNTWLYFLKKKIELLNKFKEFKDLVENQTEKKTKVLRTNHGGELCGREFK